MTVSLIQRVWEKTIKSVGANGEFGKNRAEELENALEEKTIDFDLILKKEYENKKT